MVASIPGTTRSGQSQTAGHASSQPVKRLAPRRLRLSAQELFHAAKWKAFAQWGPSRGDVSGTSGLSDYRHSNKDVASTGATLDSSQRSRKTSYDGTDSLKARRKAIKKAVSAQYGRDSTGSRR